MLFNSYIFILLFLPITLVGFQLIGRQGHHRVAISWLVAASLFFYGWWNPIYLGLILGSILFNYAIANSLEVRPRKPILFAGVSLNLGLLGYFKYANFFIDNINAVFGSNIFIEKIVLPLAISFFTFQQIAFLVDAYRGETKEHSFLQYCLFVTFFPQLIAGPIVHHKEMLPQFGRDSVYSLASRNMSVGMTIFVIGLFKKVVLADGIAAHATPVFTAAEQGLSLTLFEAWGGALAYTFQLYFDFSGYSEMALGSARMFGIVLPVNFFSPYKAVNIVDFWRRWHITLSRFLRDYLYIPLGGNRKGQFRRYVNLAVTMLLGGLWHGAAWTFVIWGGLHGFYLIINHAWHAIKRSVLRKHDAGSTAAGRAIARLITFVAVVVAWVIFRAESMAGAVEIYRGMLGLNGISVPSGMASIAHWINGVANGVVVRTDGFGALGSSAAMLKIAILTLVVWFAPSLLEWVKSEKPALGLEGCPPMKKVAFEWRPTMIWALLTGVIALISFTNLTQVSEFLYFQF